MSSLERYIEHITYISCLAFKIVNVLSSNQNNNFLTIFTPQVQKMLGGRVRLMPCGAAPFKYEVLQFFRAALGAVVLEVKLLNFLCHFIKNGTVYAQFAPSLH